MDSIHDICWIHKITFLLRIMLLCGFQSIDHVLKMSFKHSINSVIWILWTLSYTLNSIPYWFSEQLGTYNELKWGSLILQGLHLLPDTQTLNQCWPFHSGLLTLELLETHECIVRWWLAMWLPMPWCYSTRPSASTTLTIANIHHQKGHL